jgi:hypothetical protein
MEWRDGGGLLEAESRCFERSATLTEHPKRSVSRLTTTGAHACKACYDCRDSLQKQKDHGASIAAHMRCSHIRDFPAGLTSQSRANGQSILSSPNNVSAPVSLQRHRHERTSVDSVWTNSSSLGEVRLVITSHKGRPTLPSATIRTHTHSLVVEREMASAEHAAAQAEAAKLFRIRKTLSKMLLKRCARPQCLAVDFLPDSTSRFTRRLLLQRSTLQRI